MGIPWAGKVAAARLHLAVPWQSQIATDPARGSPGAEETKAKEKSPNWSCRFEARPRARPWVQAQGPLPSPGELLQHLIKHQAR